jgi:hypothetical protein
MSLAAQEGHLAAKRDLSVLEGQMTPEQIQEGQKRAADRQSPAKEVPPPGDTGKK